MIGEKRHNTETFEVLKALADTLGYCAGFLGKDCGEEFHRNFSDIPMGDAELAELLSRYSLAYAEGIQAEAMAAEARAVPIVEPNHFTVIPVASAQDTSDDEEFARCNCLRCKTLDGRKER